MKKTFFFFALFILVGFAPHVFAASNFIPLAGIPGLTQNVPATSAGLAGFFNNLYKYLIGIAAILAVIEIIYGGIRIATNQDNVSVLTDSKSRIWQAILGLVLVLSPALVFSIINPSILNLSVNLPPLNTTTISNPGSSSQSSLGTCTGSSCGQSKTVVYYAPKKDLGCNMPGSSACTFDPSTGQVIPRDASKLSDFTSGCSGVGIGMSQGDTLEQKSRTSDDNCPDDSAGLGTSGSLLGYSNICYNEMISCQSSATNQYSSSSKCTVSGMSGVLQIATCLSKTAADTWGKSCSWGRLTTDTLANGSYVVTCQGTQKYVFIDTRTSSLTTPISGLQPLASSNANSTNGNSALNFAGICQSASPDWQTCISDLPSLTTDVGCPAGTAAKNPTGTGKCYNETLGCGPNSAILAPVSRTAKCSNNPGWTIFQ